MKKSILIFALTLFVCSVLVGCKSRPLVATIHRESSGRLEPPGYFQHSEEDREHAAEKLGSSCSDPAPDRAAECDELERQILASTVRLEWHVWMEKDDGSGYTPVSANAGHATIKEGRYLVTHNHSAISLSDPKSGLLTTISVFTAAGKPLWLDAPVELVSIVVEDAETLVLDFGSYGSEGLFAAFGLSSAEFRPWESLALQSGQEVAQISWDGETAEVDWVKVESVITEHGTPRLEVVNFVMPGASGGGVFWNGYHIANTWTREFVRNVHSRAILRRYSVAALNSPQVVAQLR